MRRAYRGGVNGRRLFEAGLAVENACGHDKYARLLQFFARDHLK